MYTYQILHRLSQMPHLLEEFPKEKEKKVAQKMITILNQHIHYRALHGTLRCAKSSLCCVPICLLTFTFYEVDQTKNDHIVQKRQFYNFCNHKSRDIDNAFWSVVRSIY